MSSLLIAPRRASGPSAAVQRHRSVPVRVRRSGACPAPGHASSGQQAVRASCRSWVSPLVCRWVCRATAAPTAALPGESARPVPYTRGGMGESRVEDRYGYFRAGTAYALPSAGCGSCGGRTSYGYGLNVMDAEPQLVPFEVQQALLMEGTRPIVFARRLERTSFAMTDHTTLGGYPVELFLDMPRVFRRDGTPRLDIFAFQLRAIEDLPRFYSGQRVWLAIT